MSKAPAKNKLQNPAAAFYGLVISVGLLSIIGLVMVFSASSIYSLDTKGSSIAIFIRQLIFLAFCIPMAILLSRLSLDRWKLLARFGLVISIALLLVVRIPGIGKSVNGNQNWISLKVVDVQPSELAKFLLILWASQLLASRLNAGYMRVNVLVLIAPGFIIAIGFFIATTQYRAARWSVFLNPFDPAQYKNEGWQPAHSLLGLASGGIFGVGLGGSRQKWGNLPEAHTDFIFAVIGEELGLLGTLFILALLGTLIYCSLRIAMRSSDSFTRFACAGIASWIAIQTILNIGSAVSLLPVVGVTLPLLSYGGSALIATYLGIAFIASSALRDPEIKSEVKNFVAQRLHR